MTLDVHCALIAEFSEELISSANINDFAVTTSILWPAGVEFDQRAPAATATLPLGCST